MEKINIAPQQAVLSSTYQLFNLKVKQSGKCLFRSVITQQETGLDINFGFLLVKDKYITRRELKDYCCIKGWCIPYDFHTWNEDDDTIYDDITSLNEHGMKLPDNPSVRIVDWGHKNIVSISQFNSNVVRIIKSLKYSKDVDMVYVCGYADSATHDCLVDWDYMDEQIENACKRITYETGSTMNNVVKLV